MPSGKEYKMEFLLNAQLNGGFSGSFTKAQQEFARLGKEIQNLNRLQGDISAYQKQQTAVDNTTAKLQNLQKQHDLLQKEIGQTSGSTAALEREKLKLEQRIHTTEAALESQKQKLEATGAKLKDAGVDTANLSQKDAELTAKNQGTFCGAGQSRRGCRQFRGKGVPGVRRSRSGDCRRWCCRRAEGDHRVLHGVYLHSRGF